MTEEEKPKRPKLGGGPHGLGDPKDKFLRKTETDILIPKRIREISRLVYCKEYVDAFKRCCSEYSVTFPYSCREQNNEQLKCLEKWFYDEELRKKVTQEYLEERSEYRRTGIPKKDREKQKNNRITTW